MARSDRRLAQALTRIAQEALDLSKLSFEAESKLRDGQLTRDETNIYEYTLRTKLRAIMSELVSLPDGGNQAASS